MLCLVATLLVHGASLYSGSTEQLNQNIYTFQDEQVELGLSEITKIHNHVRYIVYFLSVILLWTSIISFIHYFFMFIALARYLIVASSIRTNEYYSKRLDKMANAAGVVHTAYILLVLT